MQQGSRPPRSQDADADSGVGSGRAVSGERGATVAQLKADIDAGRTAGKVDTYDPGLSPLGTDDEAGGRPNDPRVVELARAQERSGVAEIEQKKEAEHGRRFGLVVTLLVVLAAAVGGFAYYLASA